MNTGMTCKLVARWMTAVVLIAGVGTAHADRADSTNGEWKFSLSPLFLWAQGIQGSQTIGPVEAPLMIEFKDALSNLETTFTVHFEAKKDKLTLFGEYQYVDLQPEAEGPMGGTLNIGFENTIAELGAGYWVYGTEKTDWEIIGGGRYTKQKLDLTLENGLTPLDVREDWWVGFFGGRMAAYLSDNWTFIGRVDYGIGSGDNSIWNLNVMFDYRFKKWGSAFIGYKYMSYDYDNENAGFDRYAYDASQQGPLLGLTFHW